MVLVTGASGFVASHCVLRLLQEGYQVRATLRSLDREPGLRATLEAAGASLDSRLSFVSANLLSDTGWPEAVAGCDYVLHVASPFPLTPPRHEDDLIRPAREGTLRVLRAVHEAGVKRVVLTSSFAAIGYGHPPTERPFTEENWTNLEDANISAYVKSKTLAERAAWEFVARQGGAMELATVNPVGVFGPVLGPDYATSIQLVKRLLDGDMPGCPRLALGIVDVRDVADLHLRAMTHPDASGERFLAVAGDCMTMQEVALLLKARMGEAGRRVTTRVLPDWLVRLVARFSASVAQIAPELGKVKRASNEKAKRVLGWSPRSNEEAVIATAESLVRLGLLKST